MTSFFLTGGIARAKINAYAGVAQLFRALPCQGRGRELESLRPHHNDVFEDESERAHLWF